MFLEDFKFSEVVKIKFLIDNKSTINFPNHSTRHRRNKHIERQCHFVRDQVSKDELEIEYRNIVLQLSDILTKSLKRARFDALKGLMRMKRVAYLK